MTLECTAQLSKAYTAAVNKVHTLEKDSSFRVTVRGLSRLSEHCLALRKQSMQSKQSSGERHAYIGEDL